VEKKEFLESYKQRTRTLPSNLRVHDRRRAGPALKKKKLIQAVVVPCERGPEAHTIPLLRTYEGEGCWLTRGRGKIPRLAQTQKGKR